MGAKFYNRSATLPVIALVILFAALNYMGSALYHRAAGITTVKPFSGVALAILLIAGRRSLWPVMITGYLGGVFAKQMFGSNTLDSIVTPFWATGSLYVTWLLVRWVMGDVEFRAWRQLVGFILVSSAVCALSAFPFAGFGPFIASREFNAHPFSVNWLAWWIPTTLSYVIFTPVIVLIATAERKVMTRNRVHIAGAMAVLTVALAITFIPTVYPLSFIVPLALLIVIMVSEIEGAALGLVMTQLVYTTTIAMGMGPSAVAALPLGDQLQFSQILLGVLIVVLLPVAAAVTERRKLRDHQSEINAALLGSELRYREMARREQSASNAKSEFLAGMSHELRTPLNAILGFSEILKGELYGPLGHKKYREYAEDVHKSGTHLLDLINDVLDLSKIDSGKMELRESRFDIPALLDEALALLRGKVSGHVAFRISLPDRLPELTADRRLIKQILLNLVSNAVKFTPPGGRITIAAEHLPGAGLKIHVTDTGIGMDEAELQTAFSQYGQIDSHIARTHEGTGLGLPISKALAELHGGALLAHSIKDEGTRMTLLLPESRLTSIQPARAASA
jgi:signal transduction histidine kinase